MMSAPSTSDRLFTDIQQICRENNGSSDKTKETIARRQQDPQRHHNESVSAAATAATDEIQSTLDSLLAEVDQQIRFSICLDEELNKKASDGREEEEENSCDR